MLATISPYRIPNSISIRRLGGLGVQNSRFRTPNWFRVGDMVASNAKPLTVLPVLGVADTKVTGVGGEGVALAA